jgi:hypothetical protein
MAQLYNVGRILYIYYIICGVYYICVCRIFSIHRAWHNHIMWVYTICGVYYIYGCHIYSIHRAWHNYSWSDVCTKTHLSPITRRHRHRHRHIQRPCSSLPTPTPQGRERDGCCGRERSCVAEARKSVKRDLIWGKKDLV